MKLDVGDVVEFIEEGDRIWGVKKGSIGIVTTQDEWPEAGRNSLIRVRWIENRDALDFGYYLSSSFRKISKEKLALLKLRQ